MSEKKFRLSDHKSAQCYVIVKENEILFVSYSTVVISCDRIGTSDDYYVSCSGTYSQTTRKQIGWFLKEYFPKFNYYTMKRIAETGECLVGTRAK